MITRIQALEPSFKHFPRFVPHTTRPNLNKSEESSKSFAEVLSESREALKRQNQ